MDDQKRFWIGYSAKKGGRAHILHETGFPLCDSVKPAREERRLHVSVMPGDVCQICKGKAENTVSEPEPEPEPEPEAKPEPIAEEAKRTPVSGRKGTQNKPAEAREVVEEATKS